MNRVLMGLNPNGGLDFMAMYIDAVLVFSHDRIQHLKLVITRSWTEAEADRVSVHLTGG